MPALTAPELERLVLAAILYNNDLYAEVSDVLGELDFSVPENQIVFVLMGKLYRDSGDKKIDRFAIHEEWRAMYGNGGPERMNLLQGIQLSANHAECAMQHVAWLRDLSIKRRMAADCEEMLEIVLSGEGSGEEHLASLEARIMALRNWYVPSRIYDITDVIDEVEQNFYDIADGKKSPMGLLTGFKKFDYLMGGFHKGKMIILAARPGVGKSALAANWAVNIAMNKTDGTSVLFYTGEMLAYEITERIAHSQARLSKDLLKTPHKITKGDRGMMKRAAEEIRGMGDNRLLLDVTPAMDVNELYVRVKRGKLKNNVGLVVIDYLQLMNDLSKQGRSRQEEVGSISAKIKQMALQLELPILVLSQFNRDIEKRDLDERKPQLSDLRESGRLEQDADTVLFIHRPDAIGTKVSDVSTMSSPGGDLAQLIIAKNRGGQVGDVSMRFWKGCTRFEEVTEV